MDILKLNKLNYSYGNRKVITDFSLNIEKGSWVSIVGPNGSGKSTLVRILAGLIKTKCDIEVDGIKIDERNIIKARLKMGFIFDNPDNIFVGETVRDDIAFGLENLNLPKTEIIRRINDVTELLELKNILDKDPHRLSGGEKQKVALASILVMNAKIIVLDDALSMINPFEKKELLKVLKKLHDTTDLTIITISSNLEEVLMADKLVVMNYGIKVIEGDTSEILKQESIFIEVGMRPPFMVDLSLKLKDYDLVNDITLDMKDLVNKLWQ